MHKSKKITQQKSKPIDLLKQNNPHYPICYINEYNNILNYSTHLHKYYKTYKSNQQFKALLEISNNFDPNIFSRLLKLVTRKLHPSHFYNVINILLNPGNDSEVYQLIKNLYSIKPSPIIDMYDCKMDPIYSQVLYNTLTKYLDNPITKYLDIGIGFASFTINMGKLLNLSPRNIYGCDLNNHAKFKHYNPKFIFNQIYSGKNYPYSDNFFDIITIKLALHHIRNFDFTLKQITRILKNNGLLIVIEHDAFTYADYMIADIEHGLGVHVYNPRDTDIGYIKYTNHIELNYKLNKYGFKPLHTSMFSSNINFDVSPSRIYYTIYKKI